jgi:hypothetical protein
VDEDVVEVDELRDWLELVVDIEELVVDEASEVDFEEAEKTT